MLQIPCSLNGKSVHAVDGNGPIRKLYERALRPFLKAGAEIKIVASPTEYLNQVTPDRLPTVLITGYRFENDQTGTRLADKLKIEGFGGAILLVTGCLSYEVSGSIDEVLEKPFVMRKLHDLVLRHLTAD